jgi:hypothetical protein
VLCLDLEKSTCGGVPAESARQRTDGCRKKTRGRGAFPSSALGITAKEFDGRGKLSSMRTPKIGDRVMAIGIKKNAFTVSDDDTENQLADLKLIGSEFHERAIPWGRLVYEDEEDPTDA